MQEIFPVRTFRQSDLSSLLACFEDSDLASNDLLLSFIKVPLKDWTVLPSFSLLEGRARGVELGGLSPPCQC